MKLFAVSLIFLGLVGALWGEERISPPALASLVATERAFSRLSVSSGIREAFLRYFADDGINFAPNPVNTKKAMSELSPGYGPTRLAWQPVFGGVSQAGDLGYTTGSYVSTDLTGKRPPRYGCFFSIWRRQPDGTWKVVLDAGVRTLAPEPADIPLPFVPAGQAPPGLSRDDADPRRAEEQLIEMEHDIDRAAYPVDEFTSYMSDDIRLLREGIFPLIGKDSASTYLFERASVIHFEPVKARVARSADIGYTYGSYRMRRGRDPGAAESRGYYARIWKKIAPGQWRIAIDVAIPVRPAAADRLPATGRTAQAKRVPIEGKAAALTGGLIFYSALPAVISG